MVSKCIKDEDEIVLVKEWEIKRDRKVILINFLMGELSNPIDLETISLFEELGWSR